jgi:hypothetical protein
VALEVGRGAAELAVEPAGEVFAEEGFELPVGPVGAWDFAVRHNSPRGECRMQNDECRMKGGHCLPDSHS